VLNVDRVWRSFGSVDAVRDVSFVVPRGETVGLLGPNGAGKTTTMRMVLGIYPPDRGTVRWCGAPITGATRKRFGYLPEERGVYGRLRTFEQIVYFARLHGVAAADAARRAKEWMAMLDIEAYASRPCSELSKGNQQKVQLACSAAHGPELLILDAIRCGSSKISAIAFASSPMARFRRAVRSRNCAPRSPIASSASRPTRPPCERCSTGSVGVKPPTGHGSSIA
jgi:ABC-type uncharacterized transport system ATPase subunit